VRFLLMVMLVTLSGCASYGGYGGSVSEQPLEDVLSSQTYVLELTLGEVQSRLHEHEKFCGPFEDIETTGPKQGVWRKYAANLIGKNPEVLVIKLNQTESDSTEITGYAVSERWLAYTDNFIGVVNNVGNCSANI